VSAPDTEETAALVAELAAHRRAAARAVRDLRERLRPTRLVVDAADRLRGAASRQARRLERRAVAAVRSAQSATGGRQRHGPPRGGDVMAIAGMALSAWTVLRAWQRGRASVLSRQPSVGVARPLAWGALAVACGMVAGWCHGERTGRLAPDGPIAGRRWLVPPCRRRRTDAR